MKKRCDRLCAMLLALVLVLALLPTTVWAAGDVPPGDETPETPVLSERDADVPREEAVDPGEAWGKLATAAPTIQGYTQVTEMPSEGLEAGYYLIVVPVGDEFYVLFPGATGQVTGNVRKLWKGSGETSYTGLAQRTGTDKTNELMEADNLIIKSEGDAALYSVTAQGPENANYALFVGSGIIYSNGGTSETRIVKYTNGFGICNNHSANNNGYSYLGYYGAANLLCFGQGWHAYDNVVLKDGTNNAYENFMLFKSDREYVTPSGGDVRTAMFSTATGDNTWAVVGGRAAQGTYEDIRNARTFAGQFEEYIRWTNGGGSDSNNAARMAMQRFVVNTAYTGQTLAQVVSDGGWGRVTALDPKAAVYLAGPEDVTEAAAPAAFSADLQSFITKALALRDGHGYAAIMRPYKTADAAYNAKVDAYNAAIDGVMDGLTADARGKVLVVDSVELTAEQLTAGGWPNDKGHLALGKALSEEAVGHTISSNFPNSQHDSANVTNGTWSAKLTTDGPALPRSAPETRTNAQQTIKTKVDDASTPMTWLFMGDSITHGALWSEGQATLAQGFEKFVKDDLGRARDVVINTGVSGATTDTTVATLADRLERYDPDVVTIMLGTNDAKNLNETTFKNNLRTILNAVTGTGEGQKGAIAVLRTPIPNNRSESGQDAGGAHVHLCAQYTRDVAQETAYRDKVILVDQFAEWGPYLMVNDSNNLGASGSTFLYGQVFTADRLHPGPRGHLWMTQELIEGMGLWDASKTTCRLRYPLADGTVTRETNTDADLAGLFRRTLGEGANDSSLTVRLGELKNVAGLGVQHVIYGTVTATVNGASVTETAFRDGGTVTLEGLSATGTCSVTIQALVQTSASAGKLITFTREVNMGEVTPELTVQGYTQVKTLPANGLQEGYYLIVAPVNGHYYVLYPGATGTNAGVVNAKELTVGEGQVGTGLADSLTLDKADNLIYKDLLNGSYLYNVTAKHDETTTYHLMLQASPVYQTSGPSGLTITQPDPDSGTFRIRGGSTLCFNTASGHNNFNQMSQETEYSTIFYDMLLFRKNGVEAPSRGYGVALRMGMFPPNSAVNDDGFNSWVFTGGRAAQGLIEDIGNARNYMGHFEEYNRGNGPGGAANGHELVYQRQTINTAASGQTLHQVVSDDGWSRITALDPRAVSYLVGAEDMTADTVPQSFKDDLRALVTKSLALRDGEGFAVIQKPYKTTDSAYNAKVDLYNAAIDQVLDSLTNAQKPRVIAVESVTLTAEQLTAGGWPNDKGHWQIAFDFTKAVMGVTIANANQFPSRFVREYNGVMNQVWVNRASTEPTPYSQGSVTADADLTTAQRAIKDKMAAGDVTWLFMGDSITHGLGYAQGQATLSQSFEKFIRDDLGRTGDTVINTAVSGAGTRTTLAGTCIDARLKKYDADVVSIMLGTNDAADAAYVTVTAEQYRENLRTLVHLIIDDAPNGKGAIAILRTPIATVDNSSNRNANITIFAGIMREVYAEFESTGKVILIDQHTEWANYLKTDYSGTGKSFLYDEVYSTGISGNTLHPGPIGHLWMTHEFIDGLGLWRDESYICKLHYSVNGVTAETSEDDIRASLLRNEERTSISLALDELNGYAGSGQPVQVISAELTAAADGVTCSATGFGLEESGTVTVTGLDPSKTYQVTVRALVQTSGSAGKRITFGPFEVKMTEDLTALKAAIAAAKAAKEGVAVSTAGGDVETTRKWVTQAAMLRLEDAIAAAEAVRDDPNATQDQIDAATETMNAATEKFLRSRKDGTKTSGGGTGGGTGTGSAVPVLPPEEKPESAPIIDTQVDPSTGATTQTATYADGHVVKTVTVAGGDRSITVTGTDGEVVAQVELPGVIPQPKETFVDVPEGHWAEEAINDVAGLGLVQGVGGHRYDMESAMTRGSLATLLYRFSNGREDIPNTFEDVAEGQWYADGISWAAKAGVVTGYDEHSFGPDDIITREQLAVMLARYAKLIGLNTAAEEKTLDGFADREDLSDWAAADIAWCVENGIMQGRGSGILAPTADISRGEAAVMLARFMRLIAE